MQAVTCPVCGGNGLVGEGFYRQTGGQWTSEGGVETCRSCDGKGWITLHEPDGLPFANPYNSDGLPFAHPYNIEPLSHLKAETISSEYDAGTYWGLSGIGE